MTELIERAGGHSSSSVSQKTPRPGRRRRRTKRAKAETLGIRLATPDEFAALVADFVD